MAEDALGGHTLKQGRVLCSGPSAYFPVTQIHKKYFDCSPKLLTNLKGKNAHGWYHALGPATSSIRSIVRGAEKVQTQPLNCLLRRMPCGETREAWSA